jgi:hypothetical protein
MKLKGTVWGDSAELLPWRPPVPVGPAPVQSTFVEAAKPMPARTSWRRKLTVAGHDFLWYAADDIDGQGPVLHLFTADKALAVTYFLKAARHYPGQPALIVQDPSVVVATPDAPAWGPRSLATPSFVREVAEWALSNIRRRSEDSINHRAAPLSNPLAPFMKSRKVQFKENQRGLA